MGKGGRYMIVRGYSTKQKIFRLGTWYLPSSSAVFDSQLLKPNADVERLLLVE